MKKTLKKIYDVFTITEKTALVLLFLFITFTTVIDVLRRKLIGLSFPWMEESSRYVMVYCTMLCASIGITSDGHARMDFVVGFLKGSVKKVVRIISNLIPSGVCFYLCYWAYIHVAKMHTVGTMTTALGIPLWVCYAVMPVGLLGIAVRSLVLVITDIKNFSIPDDPKTDVLEGMEGIEGIEGGVEDK